MNTAQRIEVRRIGKRHQYEVYIAGVFAAHIRRALIGQWAVGVVGGAGGIYPTKEAAVDAVTVEPDPSKYDDSSDLDRDVTETREADLDLRYEAGEQS